MCLLCFPRWIFFFFLFRKQDEVDVSRKVVAGVVVLVVRSSTVCCSCTVGGITCQSQGRTIVIIHFILQYFADVPVFLLKIFANLLECVAKRRATARLPIFFFSSDLSTPTKSFCGLDWSSRLCRRTEGERVKSKLRIVFCPKLVHVLSVPYVKGATRTFILIVS